MTTKVTFTYQSPKGETVYKVLTASNLPRIKFSYTSPEINNVPYNSSEKIRPIIKFTYSNKSNLALDDYKKERFYDIYRSRKPEISNITEVSKPIMKSFYKDLNIEEADSILISDKANDSKNSLSSLSLYNSKKSQMSSIFDISKSETYDSKSNINSSNANKPIINSLYRDLIDIKKVESRVLYQR